MAATFELCFDPSCGQPIAQIGLRSAHGGLGEGNPLLTSPCKNFEEFSDEIGDLRKELDKMEMEAKEKFAAELPAREVRENYKRVLKTLGQKNLTKFSRIKSNRK